MSGVTAPSPSLVIKLGSIARHAEELLSIHGHDLDRESIVALLNDPEVIDWMKQADRLALLPVLRNM